MHPLATHLTTLERPDLIPTQLITQFPEAAEYLVQHWGKAELADVMLRFLVLDDQTDPRYRQLANSPAVVREVMRLSTAYMELLERIHAKQDVWAAVPVISDIDQSNTYIYSDKSDVVSEKNTSTGYVPSSHTIRPLPAQDDEWTALMQASFSGRLNQVRDLLGRGQNLATFDSDGHQALHLAAMQGHSDVVAALLAVGADANAQSCRGNTALLLAAAAGHVSVVQVLIVHDAELNLRRHDGRTALHQAVANGHDAIVARLLEAGANPLLPAKNGQTPLNLVPAEKIRMAQLLEAAASKRKSQMLSAREIVFQPLIDWN